MQRRARRARVGLALATSQPTALMATVDRLVVLRVPRSLWWLERPETALPATELSRLATTVGQLREKLPVCKLRDAGLELQQALAWTVAFMRDYFAGSDLRAPAWYSARVLGHAPVPNDSGPQNGTRLNRDAWTRALVQDADARAWFTPQRAVMLALAMGKQPGIGSWTGRQRLIGA